MSESKMKTFSVSRVQDTTVEAESQEEALSIALQLPPSAWESYAYNVQQEEVGVATESQ